MADDRPGRATRFFLATIITCLFAVALAFRVWDLGYIPGVNGDEAYYGTLVLDLQAGRPRSFTTASGLFLNPFYSGPLFLLHAVAPEPSFCTLRLPALLSGLALLALAYPLLRRLFDRPTAQGTTLLLACLPINIAYSRFGWDQSQSALISLICLYFALRRNLRWTLYSFLAALIVHPSHLFLLPILLGPAIAEWMVGLEPARRSLWLRRALLAVTGLAVVGLWLGVVGGGLLAAPSPIHDGLMGLLSSIGNRIISPTGWGRFLLLYSDLLTGTTIYRYIAGPPPAVEVLLGRWIFWGTVLLLGALAVPTLWRRRDLTVFGLVGGLVVSLLGFYLAFGYRTLIPGLERYAMWLVTPSCLIVVLLLRNAGEAAWARRLQACGLLLTCGLLLASFWQNYFVALYTTGGEAHRAFRTGPIEPKWGAFIEIERVAAGALVTILAEDWWCYYPLRYLACNHPEIEVVLARSTDEPTDAAGRRRFAVGFAGGPFDRLLERDAPDLQPLSGGRAMPGDFDGRPILLVWDIGDRTDLLDGLRAAARAAPEDDLPEW